MRITITGDQGEGKSIVGAVIIAALQRAGCRVVPAKDRSPYQRVVTDEAFPEESIAMQVISEIRPYVIVKTE